MLCKLQFNKDIHSIYINAGHKHLMLVFPKVYMGQGRKLVIYVGLIPGKGYLLYSPTRPYNSLHSQLVFNQSQSS